VKKVFFCITIISFIAAINAVPQSLGTAREVTENFLLQRNSEFSIDYSYTVEERGENLLYVFNLLPAGFIAVSGENDLTPILAYSFNQNLENEARDENLLHVMLRDDLTLRKEYFQANPGESLKNQMAWDEILNSAPRDDLRFQQWPAAGSTSTDGWIEKQWNQSGVFNQMCPLDNSGARSVVGCVATAMAMIMDFHEYIGNPVFTDDDDYSNWGGMDIDDDWEERDFPPFPELNNYLQDVAAHYAAGISLTADDKSSMNFAAGVSVEMGYSSSGSGTWTSLVPDALLNKFGYDTAEYVENEGSWFYDILIENMQSMMPTELTIYQAGYEGGHAINCDGYNTNDYFHLNFGWGTSNNTCWYSLPQGMPSGYCIITGSAVNIEGGEAPFAVQGDVNVNGASPEGAYITFDGPRFYECIVDDASGGFEIPAMLTGTYTVTGFLEQRAYYQSQENVIIDENNHFVQIDLGVFDIFTGNVTAPISTENATITMYRDGEIIHSGTTDSNGDFAIPDVLPGNYFTLVSLEGNYFTSESVNVSLEDQTEDFDLVEYLGEMGISYSGSDAGIWNLVPNFTVSCAIKLTPEELAPFENDVVAGVRFKSPINQDEGELFAQIWIDDVLMTETEVMEFSAGEWLDVDLYSFITVVADQEYYVGYKIYSTTGAMAYRDQGPRTDGKGAYFNNGSWVQLTGNNNFNFCIDAKIITQNYGTISGNVSLDTGNGNLQDVVIKAGDFTAHPDSDGNYQFDLKAGTHDLTASLLNYETDQITGIVMQSGDTIEDQNFMLINGVEAGNIIVTDSSLLIGNYPNPFNPSTTISFFTNDSNGITEISIFNLKGQKVKTLINDILPEGQHTVIWNGKDETGKGVSSGLYFYKMKSSKYTPTKKMILME
jgi:Peptidase C10 family/Spi protease inhibitor/Secretion system C-terminal sorting domain